MTREEAIRILKFEKEGVFKSLDTKKALEMAIEALEKIDKYFPAPTDENH